MARNIAVVLAGGSGSRTGLNIPKQFLPVAGKTVLEHSVEAFHRNPGIDEVVIVISQDYIETARDLCRKNGWNKVTQILPGGSERYQSSLSAINAYNDQPDCNLIFHDAARPLVTDRIISDTIKALEANMAVSVAVPSTDTIVTIKEPSANPVTDKVLDRRMLYCEQTPQGFRQSTIRQAYEIALKDPALVSTDDCGTVLKYLPQVPVVIVPGDRDNIKLTYQEDIPMVEFLLSRRSL